MLLFSRQGKLRLQKWYIAHPDKLKKKITRELVALVLSRKPKMCSFLEWKDLKVVYKRYSICVCEMKNKVNCTLSLIIFDNSTVDIMCLKPKYICHCVFTDMLVYIFAVQ